MGTNQSQPARDVTVDDGTHSQCTDTLGTKDEKNNNLQVCLSKFVAFPRHYSYTNRPLWVRDQAHRRWFVDAQVI
jgi:hypothetical protein